MYELFQRRELNAKKHWDEYQAFAKWNWLRNLVRGLNHTIMQSTWTSWISRWLPHTTLNEDFRYQFNVDLDSPMTVPKPLDTRKDSSRLPLNSSNFIDILASALEELKVECISVHNVTITSASVAEPAWIYNELLQLVISAFHNANIEVLSQRSRSDSAMKVASRIGRSEPLVLEQCGYSFNMQRRSSSMTANELNAGWVPNRLANEMLQDSGPLLDETDESLNSAAGRLVFEIAKARNILKYSYGEKPSDIEEQDAMIIVPDFGITDFAFASPLPGKNVSQAEENFTQAVQNSVESMLLKYSEVFEYQRANNLLEDVSETDPNTPRTSIVDFAKTIPHLQAQKGESWWETIDAILVLADFPDMNLIRRGACRAVTEIPGLECENVFNASFSEYGLAARGAALEADEFVKYWEMEQRWKRCEENDKLPGCQYGNYEDMDGGDSNVHEEL
jgi:hypothetical protein